MLYFQYLVIVYITSQFLINDKDDNEIQKKKYEINKKNSIFYTIKIINKNAPLLFWSPLLSTKKKDDLSDCFLQGIWYMYDLKKITILDNYEII